MGFIDTHAHLFFPEYGEDRSRVIDAARAEGIEAMINVGTDAETSRQSLALAQEHDFIFASAGIHPHDAAGAGEAEIRAAAEVLKEPRCVAIGEVGLDFYRDHSPREAQRRVLCEFLRLHRETGKPLILHCREAYEDLHALLKSEKSGWRGAMHCFSSDASVMQRFLDLGFYISFAGPLTYKKNDALREACRACPADRLLLETDAPFLPPQSMRGKRNEPRFLLETARTAAEVRGVGLEELGRITSANARRLFGL